MKIAGIEFTAADIPTGMMRDLDDGDYAVVVMKGSGFLYWGTESMEYKQYDVLEVVGGIEHRLVAHRNTRVLLASQKDN